MVITLIGLSGCGKSTLASKLAAEKNWMSVCCDDLIEQQMSAGAGSIKLKSKTIDPGNIAGVAGWLGQPFEQGYRLREKKYLQTEIEVAKSLIALAKHTSPNDNLVIDSSGSMIYVDEPVLAELGRHSIFVYLQLPDAELSEMFHQYLRDPKPVIWGNSFQQQPGESNEAALERCYPLLVAERAALYERYADFCVPVSLSNKFGLTSDMLYQQLKF